MRLADEVRAQLEAFVDGCLSANKLAGWLDSAAPELHASGGESLRRVVGQVYVVLAELDYGDRTGESTRAEVAKLLDDLRSAPIHDPNQAAGVNTGSPPV
jgi:hypothetical protein